MSSQIHRALGQTQWTTRQQCPEIPGGGVTAVLVRHARRTYVDLRPCCRMFRGSMWRRKQWVALGNSRTAVATVRDLFFAEPAGFQRRWSAGKRGKRRKKLPPLPQEGRRRRLSFVVHQGASRCIHTKRSSIKRTRPVDGASGYGIGEDASRGREGGRAGALRSARSVLICGCTRCPVAHMGHSHCRYGSGGLRFGARE